MKSIRANPTNGAPEGDERIRTAVPAPGADPAYEHPVAVLRIGGRDVPLTESQAWEMAWGLIGFCVERKQEDRKAVS